MHASGRWMRSGAASRIKGRGQGGGSPFPSGVPGRYRGGKLPVLIAVSLIIHVLVLLAADIYPRLFPPQKKEYKVYTITMADLPKGPAGGGGESQDVTEPPKKPEKAPPEPDKEAVKVADKTKQKPEPAPVKKKDKPAKPDADKTAPTAKTPTVSQDAPIGPGQGPVGGGTKEGNLGPVTLEDGIPFPFPYYIEAIEKKIRRNWKPPEMGGRRKPKVVVFFRIDRSGRITEFDVMESSGVGLVDRSAVGAVKDSSPLDRLPDKFEGKTLAVRYTFIVGDRK